MFTLTDKEMHRASRQFTTRRQVVSGTSCVSSRCAAREGNTQRRGVRGVSGPTCEETQVVIRAAAERDRVPLGKASGAKSFGLRRDLAQRPNTKKGQ